MMHVAGSRQLGLMNEPDGFCVRTAGPWGWPFGEAAVSGTSTAATRAEVWQTDKRTGLTLSVVRGRPDVIGLTVAGTLLTKSRRLVPGPGARLRSRET